MTINFHDANLLDFQLLSDANIHQLTLTIALYPIFYPNHSPIKLVLQNVQLTNKLADFVEQLMTEKCHCDDDEAICRIDSIHLDQLYSNDDIKKLWLNFDGIKSVKIICCNYWIADVEMPKDSLEPNENPNQS